ncbi:MAG: TetR/AcrR family transcriptional regulator C-terminal domain-containing protein [Magnetospirillum sp.]|nr:TetR/AcrR family transcriptional regulator C-terminal domain-containing protein [Magnetospirillum sp.]
MLQDYFAAQTRRGVFNAADPWAAAALFLGALKECTYWPALLGLPVAEDGPAIALAVEAVMKVYGPAA